MSGECINYKHYCVPFGTYCQVHKEDGPHNSMTARTQGAISMGPSNNRQGGQVFFTLTTAKVVVHCSWNVIPMPNTVIAHVNKLGRDQPNLLTFYDHSGREIGDADAEVEHEPQYETPGVVAINDVNNTGVDDDKITGVDMEAPVTTGVETEPMNTEVEQKTLQTTNDLAIPPPPSIDDIRLHCRN